MSVELPSHISEVITPRGSDGAFSGPEAMQLTMLLGSPGGLIKKPTTSAGAPCGQSSSKSSRSSLAIDQGAPGLALPAASPRANGFADPSRKREQVFPLAIDIGFDPIKGVRRRGSAMWLSPRSRVSLQPRPEEFTTK